MNPCRCALVLIALAICLAALTVSAQEPAAPPTAAGGTTAQQPAVQQPDNSAEPSPLRRSDLFVPFSRLHWSGFGIFSAEVAGGYANYPVGLPSTATTALPMSNSGFLTASTKVGYGKRWHDGFFAVIYSPTLYRQSSSTPNQTTQSGSLQFEQKLDKNWSLSFNVTGGSYDEYGTMLQQSALELVPRLQVPITNQDLLAVIQQAPAFSLPTISYAVQARQLLRGSAAASLVYRMTARNRLLFSGGYYLNRGLDGSNDFAALYSNYRSTSETWSAGFERSVTRHMNLGLSFAESRVQMSGNTRLQRQAQLNWQWLPDRHWVLQFSGGPARQDFPGLKPRSDVAVNASVGRTMKSSLVSVGYQRDISLSAVWPDAYESRNAYVEWAPQARQRHWTYSVAAGYNWMGGVSGRGKVLEGWMARPTFAIPLGASLQFYTQYLFFSQSWAKGNAQSQGLHQMDRHMALVGLRWQLARGPEAERLNVPD